MRFAAASFAVALALAAGCGAESNEPATPPPATTTEQETRAVSLYFLRDGQLGVAKRRVAETPRIGTAALEALVDGPDTRDEQAGLRSAVPAAADVDSLEISSGLASVRLSEELPPAAEAQVVFTLTQFPTVERVAFGEGAPVERSDYERLTPPILVESPAPGDVVRSPVRITGSANTFEATFQAGIVAGDEVLFEKFVTATSGSGTRGTFEDELTFELERAAAGELVVYEISAEDGSRIHEVRIPLELSP